MRAFMFFAFMTSCLSGCSIVDDVMRQEEDETRPRLASDDVARVSELYISTGRYGVMLSQARDILRLPEAGIVAGEMPPAIPGDPLEELNGIANHQARIARELLADTLAACNRPGVPDDVRQTGCETAKKVPARLQQPGPAQLAAVSGRDAELGALVMRWWDKVCAVAPKSAPGEPHACSIE